MTASHSILSEGDIYLATATCFSQIFSDFESEIFVFENKIFLIQYFNILNSS